jgi:hypothetical protein
VLANTVKDLPQIRLLTQIVENNTYITSIEITTPELPFIGAVEYSSHRANLCVALISFYVGRGISCTLQQMNEIGTPGSVKEGAKFFTINSILEAPRDIDITLTQFSNALEGKDQILTRQLGHYRKGIASSDAIKRILEFYQVLEDEYPKQNISFRQKYGYVRDLLSHAKLDRETSRKKAENLVGKPYFDPSSPQDLKALEKQARQIECDAENVLKLKLFP